MCIQDKNVHLAGGGCLVSCKFLSEFSWKRKFTFSPSGKYYSLSVLCNTILILHYAILHVSDEISPNIRLSAEKFSFSWLLKCTLQMLDFPPHPKTCIALSHEKWSGFFPTQIACNRREAIELSQETVNTLLIQASTPLKCLLLGRKTLLFLLSVMSIQRTWSISKRWSRRGTNAQEWALRYFSHILHHQESASNSKPVVDSNWRIVAKEPVPGFDANCCLPTHCFFSNAGLFFKVGGVIIASSISLYQPCTLQKPHRQHSVSRRPSLEGIPSHWTFMTARQPCLMPLQLNKVQFAIDDMQLAWHFANVTTILRSGVASN